MNVHAASLRLVLVTLAVLTMPEPAAAEQDVFASANIGAWCIVPFDPVHRGPEERAAMLQRLGIVNFAYDWRDENTPTFDAEIEAMARHGITITGWWYPQHSQPVLDALKRHGIHPQLWVCGARVPGTDAPGDPARVAREAARILPYARDARAVGSSVALYNHREPWCEDQDNQIAVIEQLRKDGVDNVGIVFNFHHWRGDLAGFAALFKRMQPYLLAVNLNGMPADTRSYPSVRFIGTDASELTMMQVIRQSGWSGPVGILHERPSLDAEQSLAHSLSGLAWLRKELTAPGSGGPKPTEEALLAAPVGPPTAH
jgi:sugar phosphate isomerase/epimerase